MPSRVRVAAGAVAVALLVWMVILFVREPTITYDSDYDEFGVVRAECGSVAGAGWPGDSAHLLDENGSGFYSDSVDGGDNLKRVTLDGIYRDCEQRRTTYVGAMALLAVPTCLLAVGAVMPRRSRPYVQPTTEP